MPDDSRCPQGCQRARVRDVDGVAYGCPHDLPRGFWWGIALLMSKRGRTASEKLAVLAAFLGPFVAGFPFLFAAGRFHAGTAPNLALSLAGLGCVLGWFYLLVSGRFLDLAERKVRLSALRWCSKCELAYRETPETLVLHHHPHRLATDPPEPSKGSTPLAASPA